MLRKFMQARKEAASEVASAPKINLKSPSALIVPAQSALKVPPKEDGNKLVVGPHIELKGSEITDCEILIVEGRVESSMKSRHIRIAQGGVFVGRAEVDVAEIRGDFEGELIVHKRLIIYASAKIHGNIRYAAMTVEDGAELTGNIDMLTQDVKVHDFESAADVSDLPGFRLVQSSQVLGHQR
jgi:cytoskeletal protein CcmA (bactofilin family)